MQSDAATAYQAPSPETQRDLGAPALMCLPKDALPSREAVFSSLLSFKNKTNNTKKKKKKKKP